MIGYHGVVGGIVLIRSSSGFLLVVVVVIRRHLDCTSCVLHAREPLVEMIHLGGPLEVPQSGPWLPARGGMV